MEAENANPESEVSIVLTDDFNILQLNSHYRGINKATDVLSFVQAEGDISFDTDMDEYVLGDVIISVETARKKAKANKADVQDEVELLLTHGILHLLGYDHAKIKDEKIMFARQQELLELSGNK